MSYLNRVWMTAGVAVFNGHTDQGHKLKSGIKSFQQGKRAFTSSAVGGTGLADLRPLSGVLGSEGGGFVGGEERMKQSDDSLRQVMHLNCNRRDTTVIGVFSVNEEAMM